MAHLSHKTLNYLPETLSEHEAEEAQPDSVGSFSFWPPHLEKVFPVYAMGIPNPVLDSSLQNSDCFDPIWDDVRKEAQLEVPIIFFPHLLWLLLLFVLFFPFNHKLCLIV